MVFGAWDFEMSLQEFAARRGSPRAEFDFCGLCMEARRETPTQPVGEYLQFATSRYIMYSGVEVLELLPEDLRLNSRPVHPGFLAII